MEGVEIAERATEAQRAVAVRQRRIAALREAVFLETGCRWGTLGAQAELFPEDVVERKASRRGGSRLVLSVEGRRIRGREEDFHWLLLGKTQADRAMGLLGVGEGD